MSERSIETVRKYVFDPKEVVAGLNGYYESDKRNNYITIRRNDVVCPAYFSTLYLSALIEWLREDHDIFYRPGMTLDQVEAARSAAKMCCLRAHIKDEICKRGLWCGADEDVPELVDTLFKAYDECVKHRDKNRKDAVKLSEEIRKLKVELNAIKDTVSQARSRFNSKFVSLPGYEEDLVKLADIALIAVEARDETINRINVTAQKEAKQECYDYLWNALKNLSPDCDALKITDYEDLVDRIFYEMSLVEDGCKRCQRGHTTEKFDYIQKTNKAEEEVKKLKEQLGKATADYQALNEENQKLKDSQKSDTNQLIRDYCTKNGIIAPSRYLSDEACVEYLFSVVDFKQKNRAAVILQDLYRDIFKKQPDGLSAEDIANKILDKVLETEDLLHKSVDSSPVIASRSVTTTAY